MASFVEDLPSKLTLFSTIREQWINNNKKKKIGGN